MASKEKIVFYHIPKCGGTSVRKVLRSVYGGSLAPWVGKSAHIIRPEEDKGYRCYSGHYSPPAMRRKLGKFKEGCLLRDPVERLYSVYHYCRSCDMDWVMSGRQIGWPYMPHLSAKTNNLPNFLVLEKERLTNAMMKQLCGRNDLSTKELLGLSKDIIDDMDCVGLLEDGLDIFLERLLSPYGGSVPHLMAFDTLPKEQSYFKKIERQPKTPEVLALMLEITEGDRQLYQYTKDKLNA